MNNILLFEPDNYNSPHMTLLLKVAELQCTVTESAEELINWISTNRLKDNPFDLILLNSWPELDGRNELFHDILAKSQLPVIFVSREKQAFPQPPRHVSICMPENLLSCINAHLSQTASAPDQHSACAHFPCHENMDVAACSCRERTMVKNETLKQPSYHGRAQHYEQQRNPERKIN